MNDRPLYGGGSEILKRALLDRLKNYDPSRVNLILNNAHPSFIQQGKLNVLWIHHNTNEAAIANIASKGYTDQIDHFVYVSHWQYEKYRRTFRIPESKSIVIRNAIAPQRSLVTKPDRLKLIYTTTPWRGLDLLLDCFELLDRDDVSLDVYSSTIIYGEKFHRKFESQFLPIFERAKRTRNVNYHGFVPNEQVREALLSAHVFAYPCIWEETSCLSAVEAAMAGLSIVTTNVGALPETLGPWARFVVFDSNVDNLRKKYTQELKLAIDHFWDRDTQETLLEQHRHFLKFWSWDSRLPQWEQLLLRSSNA